MGEKPSKALLTSLVLFIVLGLFSLATLFTVLILEVRSGQQQLNQQLSQLSGIPLPELEGHPTPFDLEQPLAHLQATLDVLIGEQQERIVPDYSQQLHAIEQRLQQLQQTAPGRSETTSTVATLPETLNLQLQSILTTVQSQQRQQQQLREQLALLLKREQGQQQQMVTNRQLLTQLSQQLATVEHVTPEVAPVVAAPALDLDPLLAQLQQLDLQQQSLNSSHKQLEKLTRQIATTQQSVMALVTEPVTKESDSTPQLAAITNQLTLLLKQQKQMQLRQQRVEKLTQQLSLQPANITSTIDTESLEPIHQRLDQLTQQQLQTHAAQQRLEKLSKQIQQQSVVTTAPATIDRSEDFNHLNLQLEQLTQQQLQTQTMQQRLEKLVQQIRKQKSAVTTAPATIDHSEEFNQLNLRLEQLTQQQLQTQAMQQQLEKLAQQIRKQQSAVTTTPVTIDRSEDFDQLNLRLEQLAQQQLQTQAMQQHLEKLTQQIRKQQHTTPAPTAPTPAVDEEALSLLHQRLDQLTQQQLQMQGSQKKLEQLSRQIQQQRSTTPPVDQQAAFDPELLQPITRQLQRLSKQQQQSHTNQRRLEQLTQSLLEQQQTATPAPAAPAISREQFDALNQRLESLTQQQQQSERNLLKSMEQSNTIRPYSYNAR